MKKCILLVLAVSILLLALGACDVEFESDSGFEYTFINNSSYDLTIRPNEQSWDEFLLESGTTETITVWETTISFYYNYALVVDCDTSGDNVAVFTDSK